MNKDWGQIKYTIMKTRLEVHSLSSFPIFHINIEIIWRCMVVRKLHVVKNEKNITFAERNQFVLIFTFTEMRALTIYGVDRIHDPPRSPPPPPPRPEIFTTVWNVKGWRGFVLKKKVNANPRGRPRWGDRSTIESFMRGSFAPRSNSLLFNI